MGAEGIPARYEGLGAPVGSIFLLKNGWALGVTDWYEYGADEQGIYDAPTYKVYSGGDKFHIRKDDIEEIIGWSEVVGDE